MCPEARCDRIQQDVSYPALDIMQRLGLPKSNFFISCSFPINFTCSVGLDVSDDECLKSVSNCIPVLIEINFSDLKPIVALENAFFAGAFNLDKNLTGAHIVEQIFSFFEFFDTSIISIDWSA